MKWRLRRVVPALAVTTHAKPHAQQQLARDLEVERAAMGQRCRPQGFGEVQRGNPQQGRLVTFLHIFWANDSTGYPLYTDITPDHGITRHNKPQRPPDDGHNTA